MSGAEGLQALPGQPTGRPQLPEERGQGPIVLSLARPGPEGEGATQPPALPLGLLAMGWGLVSAPRCLSPPVPIVSLSLFQVPVPGSPSAASLSRSFSVAVSGREEACPHPRVGSSP